MVKYTCERCIKEFDRKSNYKSHLNRKIPCNWIIPTDPMLNNTTNIVTPTDPLLNNTTNLVTPTDPLLNNTTNLVTPTDPSKNKILTIEHKHICLYCNKFFSKNSGVHRHMRLNCKIKKQQDGLKQELYTKLVEQKKEQDDRLTEKKKLTGNSKRKLLQEELEKKNIEIKELDKKNKEISNSKQKEIEEISNSKQKEIEEISNNKQKEIDELQNKIKEKYSLLQKSNINLTEFNYNEINDRFNKQQQLIEELQSQVNSLTLKLTIKTRKKKQFKYEVDLELLNTIENHLDSEVDKYNRFNKNHPMTGISWIENRNKWRLQYFKLDKYDDNLDFLVNKMKELCCPKNQYSILNFRTVNFITYKD
jgi:hypothetical protein